jgi:hypothetical protein
MTSWGLRHTGRDLRVISAELRYQGNGREVRKKFSRELRAAAAPMVPAVRASIAAIPVKGTSGSTGLRKRLQKATTLRVRTIGRNAQVSISVAARKMPDGQKALPAYMEGTKSPWRHPVFNDPDTWVSQPSHAYFYPVVRKLGVASKVAVARVVNEISRDIT